MKIILALIAALGFLGLITYSVKKADVGAESVKAVETVQSESLTTKEKSPVLVELFTSEGCSSCPPADKNLIYLNNNQPVADAEVITLAMHVDYWDRLGWKDVFSAAQYSQRQEFYSNTFNLDGVYTPQMVIDGESQFVGGNLNEAQNAIVAATKLPKGEVKLSIAENKLNVKISDLPTHTPANIFIAVAEDNLSTVVKNGENGGRTLPHTSVVRELRTIGKVGANENNFAAETEFQLQPSWKKQNVKLVVFVQVAQNSQIIGVNQIKL